MENTKKLKGLFPDKKGMIKVLFTSPLLEHPPVGGPTLRIENSIKALSRVCDLTLVSRAAPEAIGGKPAENFYQGFCRQFLYAPSARLSQNRYARRLQKEWHKRFMFQDARFLLDLIDREGIDVLWWGYGNISFDLIHDVKRRRPNLKCVCDTDSVWSRFVLRELPFEKNGWRRARIEREGRRAEFRERRAVSQCTVTTGVSKVDADYYRSIATDPEKVMVFSNVIDLKTYETPPPPAEGLKRPCLYLAGTFGHTNSPMDRAAQWMIEEVLPRVQKEIPPIHLYLVGRGSERVWGRLNNPAVTVTGQLPSVLPYLCHADVVVVPLQFESGTRFKILEAGACQRPIVSTTLGAEGLEVVPGRDILIADTPDDFAKAILRLIQDKAWAAQLAGHGQKLVRERYSVEFLAQEAQQILRRLTE